MSIPRGKIILVGRIIKIAKLKDEWFDLVDDPEKFIKKLKNSDLRIDIFTFKQAIYENQPIYKYNMDLENFAVIPISSYNNWFRKQINHSARKAIRKAKKSGVIAKVVDFDDDLVKGITKIFNETAIRQGRPYPHFGKDFEAVKCELSKNLNRDQFIGAYYNDELIGFIQLRCSSKYAVPFGMVSSIGHRNKSPQNALIEKAVEICEKMKIQLFIYGYWSRGGLGDFKRHMGCEKIPVPRYFIALTLQGKIALFLKLHKNTVELLPTPIYSILVRIRNYVYKIKYQQNIT